MDQLIEIKKFRMIDNIGRGSFSIVLKVKNLKTNQILVAKILRISEYDSDENRIFLREAKILSIFKHPAIIKYYGYSLTDFNREKNPVIFLEYMVNGSLDEIIKKEKEGKSPSNWNDTKKLINIYGISSAMMYFHSKNIIHRDLKPANILEDENFYPKLADFGLSRPADKTLTSSVGTIFFMAPEVIEEFCYSSKIDVYSFGMTVFLLMIVIKNSLLNAGLKIQKNVLHLRKSFQFLRKILAL